MSDDRFYLLTFIGMRALDATEAATARAALNALSPGPTGTAGEPGDVGDDPVRALAPVVTLGKNLWHGDHGELTESAAAAVRFIVDRTRAVQSALRAAAAGGTAGEPSEAVLEEIYLALREPCTLDDARTARSIVSRHLNAAKIAKVRAAAAGAAPASPAVREAAAGLIAAIRGCGEKGPTMAWWVEVDVAIEVLRAVLAAVGERPA